MQSHPNFGNFATVRYISAATTGSTPRYTFHIWQLDRATGGVAPTVTFVDFDLLLWHWHI